MNLSNLSQKEIKKPVLLWMPIDLNDWLNKKSDELNLSRTKLINHILKEAKEELEHAA